MPNNIVDANVWKDPLETPADGDNVDAATMLANDNQGVADRTRYLMKAIAGTNDVVAGEQVSHSFVLDAGHFVFAPGGLITGLTREIPLSEGLVLATNNDGVLSQFATRVSGTGFHHYLVFEADSQRVQFQLNDKIPYGALITRVRAIVQPNVAEATSADRMRLTVQEWTNDYATPANGSITEHADIRDDGTNNLQTLDSGAITIRNTGQNILAQIAPSINAADAAGDDVHAIEVEYTHNTYGMIAHHGHFTGVGGGCTLHLPHPTDSVRGKAVLDLNRFIPFNATLTDVRVMVKPGAARGVGSRVQAVVWANPTRAFTGGVSAGNPVLQGATVEDDGTVATQVISLLPAYTVDGSPLQLLVEGGTGDWDIDQIFGVELVFNDPGARNF